MTEENIPDFAATLAEANRLRTTPPNPRRKFIKWLMGLGVVGLGGWGYMKFEADWLEVRRETLPTDQFPVRRSFSILHLSDFHVSDKVPFSISTHLVNTVTLDCTDYSLAHSLTISTFCECQK